MRSRRTIMWLIGCWGVWAGAVAGADVVEYTGSSLRDPFTSALPEPKQEAPAPVEVAQEPEPAPVSVDFLTVEGIVWGAERPQAVINGRLVAAGGVIQDAAVVQIDETGVLVRYRGKEFLLRPGTKRFDAATGRQPQQGTTR